MGGSVNIFYSLYNYIAKITVYITRAFWRIIILKSIYKYLREREREKLSSSIFSKISLDGLIKEGRHIYDIIKWKIAHKNKHHEIDIFHFFLPRNCTKTKQHNFRKKLLSQKYFVNFFHKYVHLSYRALRLVVQQIQRVGIG